MVPPVNASYLHERLRPRSVTGLPGGSSMSAPFGELGSVGGGPTFAEAMVNGALRRDRSSTHIQV